MNLLNRSQNKRFRFETTVNIPKTHLDAARWCHGVFFSFLQELVRFPWTCLECLQHRNYEVQQQSAKSPQKLTRSLEVSLSRCFQPTAVAHTGGMEMGEHWFSVPAPKRPVFPVISQMINIASGNYRCKELLFDLNAEVYEENKSFYFGVNSFSWHSATCLSICSRPVMEMLHRC